MTTLPKFMIPTEFVRLKSFPTNLNGKIDRKQLPMEKNAVFSSEGKLTLPENELESKLVAIWKTVLHQEIISTTSNFFEIGGNSIKLIQLHALIKEQVKKEVNVVDLFNYSTVQEQARHFMHGQNINAAIADEEINVFEL